MVNRWVEAWRRPTQGFHQNAFNPHLLEHCAWLSGAGARSVLVPLCGRSLDMVALAERFERVIGVELVERAVSRFFEDRGLSAQRHAAGQLERWQAGQYELHRGDILAAEPRHLGSWDAIFDRAALIALPPELRRPYVKHLTSMTRSGARMLLITLHYDLSTASGPPYSVADDEVHAHFAADWELSEATHFVPETLPAKFDGIEVTKSVWRLQRR